MTRVDRGLHAFGRGFIRFFIAFLAVLEKCKTQGLSHQPGRYLQDLPEYDVVHPTRVDAKGHFLSNFLSHHARRVHRREASQGPVDLDRVFYQLWHGGHSLHFNLTLNKHLLAPGFLTEKRYGGLDGVQISAPESSQCYFLGEVWDEDTVKGNAAISTCDGLHCTAGDGNGLVGVRCLGQRHFDIYQTTDPVVKGSDISQFMVQRVLRIRE